MRYLLDNGLTVIFERQQSAPVVALQVWVKAGSADETPEEAGLAHLHEHMLFKGTARRGLGEIARDVEARGGEINAWTSFDQTVYHLVLASRFFAEGLDILADAVRQSAFDAGELAREIEVVVEEIKRSADLPSRKVAREMFETAYRAHPYRNPVLGTEESVRSFTRDKVLAFYRRHYTPDNMVLVVVGDVEEPRARAEIERLFGGEWGRRAHPPRARAVEPPQTEARVALVHDAVKEAHFSLAFHIPEVAHASIPALDVLAVVLGQGEGSRLSLGLKIERPLASDSYAYAYTPQDPGLLVAGAALAPENTREALGALIAEIRRLQLEPVPEAELAVAKAIIESDAVYGKETVQGVARKLGFYEAVAGSLEFESRYYEGVARVTAEELRQAAREWLDLRKATFAGLLPDGHPLTEAEILSALGDGRAQEPLGRVAPPRQEPSSARAARRGRAARQTIDSMERVKLDSGVTVVVKPERGVPLVAVRGVYPGGLRYETEENNGITQLYARTMTRATRRRSVEQVAREMDEMAASVQASAGRNSLSIRGEFLSKHFHRALRLMAECMLEPAFQDGELERERSVLLQDIRSRDDNPSGAAFDLFARTLYTVHPYRLDTLGEAAPVARLTADDLLALKGRALDPASLTLCLVGDVDPDEAFALVEELFGEASGASARAPRVPVEPAQHEPRRAFRELDKAQAHLVYGALGTTVSAPERFALDVLSSVLSGQGGRLFVELRDRKSLAYSVSSFSVEGIDPGYFGVYMGTSPEKVASALPAIRAEIDKLLEAPVTEAELERAKRYLIGTHAIGLQKYSARAALIAYDEAYGIGAASYARYQEHLEQVDAEQVLAAARRVLDPRRTTLAILGPKQADVAWSA